jgi:hypothetical protein
MAGLPLNKRDTYFSSRAGAGISSASPSITPSCRSRLRSSSGERRSEIDVGWPFSRRLLSMSMPEMLRSLSDEASLAGGISPARPP